MHPQTIRKSLEKNTQKLVGYLNQVPENIRDRKPSPRDWSILDCSEHLFQVENGIRFIFQGKTRPKEDNHQHKGELIRGKFLDQNIRYRAAGPILPQGHFTSLSQVSGELETIRAELLHLGDHFGWEEVCLDFKHALFGYLSREEWIGFIVVHTERHLEQMEKIRNALSPSLPA